MRPRDLGIVRVLVIWRGIFVPGHFQQPKRRPVALCSLTCCTVSEVSCLDEYRMARHAMHCASLSVTVVPVPLVWQPPRRLASNITDSASAGLFRVFNSVGARHVPLRLNASFTECHSD